MNSEVIQTIIRALLKVGGGALAAKGLTTEAAVETAIGAVVALVGFVWGIIKAKKAKEDAAKVSANGI